MNPITEVQEETITLPRIYMENLYRLYVAYEEGSDKETNLAVLCGYLSSLEHILKINP